jgi:hypothetical protein
MKASERTYQIYTVDAVDAVRMATYEHPGTGTEVLSVLREAVVQIGCHVGRIS